ncbi:MAG: TIGR02302 family protein [Mesorhizobium sp.]
MADANSAPDTETRPAGARLAGTRIATRLVMVFERLWPLILPAILIASLFVAASWFGLFRLIPEWLRLTVLGLAAVGLLVSLYPLRRFRAPDTLEIDRRIEQHNQLVHTPIQVQDDRLTGDDSPFAKALWREHKRRMASGLGRLDSDLPRTGIPARDPWGLRVAVPLLLVTAFAYSFGSAGGNLADPFRPAPGIPPVPPRIDAWVTPPAYTGRAPIFLTAQANSQAQSFDVPQGSDVTLRVTGGGGGESLAYIPAEGQPLPMEQVQTPTTAPTAPRNFTGKLLENGRLSLQSGDTELMGWAFNVIPDMAPHIAYLGEPKRAVNGTLELTYSIKDDYGAASAAAEFDMVEPQAADARPLFDKPDMPLSLPRRTAKDGAGKTSRDLTEHVWAGIEVRATLKAVDAAGQEARSETKTFRLPERPFSNPLARAVVEQRRILGLDANRKARVLDLMEAVMLRPEDTITNASHWLALSSVRARLLQASSDDQLREVADYMWDVALAIEDGDLSAAEKALRQAQEALKNALENGASEEEIARLMDELRQAMQNYLREFAERSQQNPNASQQQQNSQQLRQSDLDRMLDRIEELAKSGARDQAQELLSQLQDMMNNLQAGRQQQQQGQGQSEMRQQMDELGQLMRRQLEMMNETHRLNQMQRGEGQQGEGEQGELGQNGEQGEAQQGQQGQPGGQGQGQGRGMSPGELSDALRGLQQGQNQLRDQLGRLMQGLEGLGIQPGQGFGEAGEAMGEAGRQLGQAQGEEAVGEQGRALEALRRGAQDMMQQMQQAMQGEQGDGENGARQERSGRDPLGRPRATTGPDFGDTVRVPDEIDVQRAREILDAIRKRLGNALSPEIERDYLERLLKMQ